MSEPWLSVVGGGLAAAAADNHLQRVLGLEEAKTHRGLGVQALPREHGSHRDRWVSRGVLLCQNGIHFSGSHARYFCSRH